MKLFVILVILATKAFSLPHGIVDETLGGEPERYAAFAESPSESLSLASQEMNDDVIATSENDEAPAYVYATTQELEGMEMMGEDDMPEPMGSEGMEMMGEDDMPEPMGSEGMEMMGEDDMPEPMGSEGMEMMGEDDMPEPMGSEDDMATMRSENDMLEIESTTPGFEMQSDEEMINESPMADSENFHEQEVEEMQAAIMLDEVRPEDEVLDDQSDDLDEKPSQETDDDKSRLSDDQEMVSSLAAAYPSDGINNYYVN